MGVVSLSCDPWYTAVLEAYRGRDRKSISYTVLTRRVPYVATCIWIFQSGATALEATRCVSELLAVIAKRVGPSWWPLYEMYPYCTDTSTDYPLSTTSQWPCLPGRREKKPLNALLPERRVVFLPLNAILTLDCRAARSRLPPPITFDALSHAHPTFRLKSPSTYLISRSPQSLSNLLFLASHALVTILPSPLAPHRHHGFVHAAR